MPGPLLAVTAISPRERGADGGGDRGDLVLGLEREHVEALVPRKLVEDVARRGDWVRSEEEPLLRLLSGRQQAPREGRVAHDVAVLAGRELGRSDLVLGVDRLDGLAVVEPGLQGPGVRLGDFRLLAELRLDEPQRGVHRPVVEPEQQAHGEEVAAAVGFFGAQPEALDGRAG